jgi:hypothetical protein
MALQHSRRVEAFLRATVRAQRDEIADLRSMMPS